MTLRVAISDPRLVSPLADTLCSLACTVRALSDRTFELTTVAGTRPDVEFFLRAWQNAHPGVDVVVG